MTKRQSIADRLRAKGFPPITEEQYQDNIRELVPTVCFCEETAMTTDLSSKSVEELREAGFSPDPLFGDMVEAEAFDEIARRLEEAQQKIALAKAEALEEAIERLWERVGCEEYGHAKAAVTLDIEAIRELAAEYRGKAGRKE